MKKHHYFIIPIIIIIIDQLLKLLAKTYLTAPKTIIKNFLQLNLTFNTGASFGLLKNLNWILIIITIIIIGIIFYYYKKTPKKALPYTMLILGGAFGNLIDRIAFGAVIDYIDFTFWSVFNFADIAITVGVVLLIIYLWEK